MPKQQGVDRSYSLPYLDILVYVLAIERGRLEFYVPRTGNFSVLEFTHANGHKFVCLELFPTHTRISRETGLLHRSDEWLAEDKVGFHPFLSSSSIHSPFLHS